MKRTIIGLDLDKKSAQISFYNERSMEPETVSVAENQNRYMIPTPPDLFSLIEGSVELGLMALANFLKKCISHIRPAIDMETAYMMVTMKEITSSWRDALVCACEMMGLDGSHLFLQTHRESFCAYTLNQKKELWVHRCALFEYEQTQITAYVMDIDYATRPALVRAGALETADMGTQGKQSREEWDAKRDAIFLELIQNTFQTGVFSAAFLIGEQFDKTWTVESLPFLCRRRHVFMGQNLYTKGACYSAMQRLGEGKKLDAFLYQSEDLVEKNLSMQMEIRGKKSDYFLINAGVNWFEADFTCEFILDETNEVVIYSKSMRGGVPETYTITLKDLPKRPPRTTRLQMRLKFISQKKCKVTIRDLGFGEFYPASGLAWESILEV